MFRQTLLWPKSTIENPQFESQSRLIEITSGSLADSRYDICIDRPYMLEAFLKGDSCGFLVIMLEVVCRMFKPIA